MNFPAGSVIRTPAYTLLTKPDGYLRCLREGEKTWKSNGVNTMMPYWLNLALFLAEKKPEWWQVDIAYPKDWFVAGEHPASTAGGDASFGEEAYRQKQPTNEIYNELHKKFREEIVAPLAQHWGLLKASDESSYVHKWGTYGSPYSKTAEQQFREIEPDQRKWIEMAYAPGVSAKAREKFLGLWYRYQRSQKTPAAPPAPPAAPPAPPAAPAAPPPAAPPAPIAVPLTRAEKRKEWLELTIKAKKLKPFLSATVDPENVRKITVVDRDGEICGEAFSLSPDTVYATIYLENGGSSNHYMPLTDFLALYTEL